MNTRYVFFIIPTVADAAPRGSFILGASVDYQLRKDASVRLSLGQHDI